MMIYVGKGLLLQLVVLGGWIALKERDPTRAVFLALLVGHSIGGVLSGVGMWASREFRRRSVVTDYLGWGMAGVAAFLPAIMLSADARGEQVNVLAVVGVLLSAGVSWRVWIRYLEASE